MRFSRVLTVIGVIAIVLIAAVWMFVAEDLGRVRGAIRAASALETPELALQALVAAEDPDHFRHSRFHSLGNVASAFAGSSATMPPPASLANQLVRSSMEERRGLTGHLRELLIVAIVEATESPSAILRAYAANVYLGSRDDQLIFGIHRGAQNYFGKPAASLTAEECAALAAAVRSPHLYPVLGKSERAVARRLAVLRRMGEGGVP